MPNPLFLLAIGLGKMAKSVNGGAVLVPSCRATSSATEYSFTCVPVPPPRSSSQRHDASSLTHVPFASRPSLLTVHDDDHQQHLPTRSVVALPWPPRSATKLFSVPAPAPRHVRHRLPAVLSAFATGHSFMATYPSLQTGARVNARHAFTLRARVARALA